MGDDLASLQARSHDDITLIDLEAGRVPCIIMDAERYDRIISETAGRPLVVDTNLNILQDGLGHVFVDVKMSFSIGGIAENVLIDASGHLDFFESLARTGMIALSSPRSDRGQGNIFVVQLPRRDGAEQSLDMIRRGLASGVHDGAVTGI